MKLFEVVKERKERELEKAAIIKAAKASIDELTRKINDLRRLESSASAGFNVELIQIAESVLAVQGEPWLNVEGRILTDAAAEDIANDCPVLRQRYFGVKIYSGFGRQQCDCGYGMGPTHGGIVDAIRLRDKATPLTDEQKDACIYYLKNLQAIKTAAQAATA